MKGNTMNTFTNVLMPLFLGVVVAVIVFTTLAGKTLPLIGSPRASLVALLVVGMAMCMGGIGQVGASGRWGSPMAIVGYLLGAAILLIIISAFAGWKLLLISGETQSVAAVGILIAVKYLIGTVSFLFHWL
ncbi:MAG TPA: hypothetical protein VK897_18290 [Anaerolineales bacterium]|nr:hypothetical protein [Anaerolineales bacterium]